MTRERAARFDAGSVREAWDAAADSYAGMQAAGNDFYRYEFFGPAMLEACGDVAGLEAIDLGCGAGYFSRRLAERRARVVGVDLSPRLLAHAREREEREPLGIGYREADAADAAALFPSASFDLATSCLSLLDMPEPAAVVRGAAALLRSGGRFVATIPHPATDCPHRRWIEDAEGRRVELALDRYFETGPILYRWRHPRYPYPFETPGYHPTIEEATGWFLDAGFRLDRLLEPRPTPEAVGRHPDLAEARRLPFFLILVGLRQNDSGPRVGGEGA